MSLLIPAGTNAIDLAVPGTYRQDISDLLLAVLYLDPSFLGTLQSGEGFSGNGMICQWDEEALNPSSVVDLTPGGLTTAPLVTSMIVSNADASVLDIGNVLADGDPALGGLAGSERIQVQAKSAPNVPVLGQTTLTVIRGAQGTTPQTHLAGATFFIISQAIEMNSDLGADKSRPRVPKFNYLQREDFNVNLGSEAIDSSLAGYTPGVPNEFTKQIKNRLLEKLIIWNRTFEYGIGTAGDGTTGLTSGNESTTWGLIQQLSGGTFNPTAVPFDYVAHGLGAGQIDVAINDVNAQAFAAGVRNDYLYTGTLGAQAIARLFKDQIRITQDETTRGFYVQRIRTLLANELVVIVDGYLSNVQGAIDMAMVDSSRIRIRPFQNEFMRLITSPSFRDGDAARVIMKAALETRNTGTDTGQAHTWIKNVTA